MSASSHAPAPAPAHAPGGFHDEKAPDAKKPAAKLFVECLENEGCKVIFGLPGEENADFVLALQDSSIRYILVRQEQGAAFMADAYGRLTQQPGVCFATLGPGATNLVTGVADANMDRAPVVVLTGQADTRRLHKESHQAMDVLGMFKPIVKWNAPVLHPENIPEIVHKAFKLSKLEKPGACHIELSEDIAGMEATGIKPLSIIEKVRRSVPDDKIIDEIWSKLRQAKRPVVLAGNGCLRHKATKQLEAFVTALHIPVVMTFMGKGAISSKLAECCFTVGLASGDANNRLLDKSDFVISCGYDLVEYHPRLWNPTKNIPIVHIDFTPAEVDAHYRCMIEAVGDLSHSLWMLNERQKREPIAFDPAVYADVRDIMLKDFASLAEDATVGALKPQKVLWDVRKVLGAEDILLSDVGAHKMWIARYYQCEAPNTCLISNGFCSMGFALPGAIGAKIAFPERRVLAICGDGGFLMNVQEMETAKRVGANIVVMVWCDGGYGLISWKQDTRYGRHTNLSFENPKFDHLAAAFGWKHFHVRESAALAATLQQAFSESCPVLVSLDIDYSENPKLTKRLGGLRMQN